MSGLSLDSPGPQPGEDPAPPPRRGSPSPGRPLHRLNVGLSTMPLYEGLGSGGEKTAVVIDLGEAFTK